MERAEPGSGSALFVRLSVTRRFLAGEVLQVAGAAAVPQLP